MLTPIDIQNHGLKSGMGGYSKKETDDFIEKVQGDYEILYKENHDLKEKITALSEGLQYYKQMEGTLQKTLVLAEKTATETLEASRNQAVLVEKESKEKADAILSEAQQKADSLLSESQRKSDELLSTSEKRSDNIIKDAQDRAAVTLEDAKASAHSLLTETKNVTDDLLKETNSQLSEVSDAMQKLVKSYEDYKEQFKALVNSQLEALNGSEFELSVSDEAIDAKKNIVSDKQSAIMDRVNEMIASTETIDVTVSDGIVEEELLEDFLVPAEEPVEEVAEEAVSELPSMETASFEQTENVMPEISSTVENFSEEPSFQAVIPPEAEKTPVPVAEIEEESNFQAVIPPETEKTPVPAAEIEAESNFQAVVPPVVETVVEQVTEPVFETVSTPEAVAVEEPSFQAVVSPVVETPEFASEPSTEEVTETPLPETPVVNMPVFSVDAEAAKEPEDVSYTTPVMTEVPNAMAAYQLAADEPPVEMEAAPVAAEVPNAMAAYQLAADTPPEMPAFQSATPITQEAPIEQPVFNPMTETPSFDTFNASNVESVNFGSATSASEISYGVTGNTETEAVEEPASPSSLFSSEVSFGKAGAGTGEGDGFGISETPSQPSENSNTPFTFFDAN